MKRYVMKLTNNQSQDLIESIKGFKSYITINSVESTEKRKGDVYHDCLLVTGIQIIYGDKVTGTSYIYSDDKKYKEIYNWFKKYIRDYKLEELGI